MKLYKLTQFEGKEVSGFAFRNNEGKFLVVTEQDYYVRKFNKWDWDEKEPEMYEVEIEEVERFFNFMRLHQEKYPHEVYLSEVRMEPYQPEGSSTSDDFSKKGYTMSSPRYKPSIIFKYRKNCWFHEDLVCRHLYETNQWDLLSEVIQGGGVYHPTHKELSGRLRRKNVKNEFMCLIEI